MRPCPCHGIRAQPFVTPIRKAFGAGAHRGGQGGASGAGTGRNTRCSRAIPDAWLSLADFSEEKPWKTEEGEAEWEMNMDEKKAEKNRCDSDIMGSKKKDNQNE